MSKNKTKRSAGVEIQSQRISFVEGNSNLEIGGSNWEEEQSDWISRSAIRLVGGMR